LSSSAIFSNWESEKRVYVERLTAAPTSFNLLRFGYQVWH
jgi:hypothetical protein